MSSKEWKTYKLGELTEIIGGGTPKTTVPEYWNGDIPWLSVVDFGGEGKYVSNTEKKITSEGLKNSSTKLLKEGQLIISARGTVGEIAMLKKDMAFNQSCYGLNAKEMTSNNFLYYIVKYNLIEIKSKTHGAVFDTITKETFNHIEIHLPNTQTQQRIVSILSSLDDKIELNRQTNQTLEGIAQTLFQEMCVPKGDELPEGWRVGKLGEIIKIKHGYAFKGEFFSEEETEDILLTPGNFKIGGGFNYSKFKYYKGDIPKDYILTENDLVVTMTDLSKEGDTLGYSALVPTIQNKQLLHNQRVGKIEYKGNEHLKFFLYFTMREKDYRNFVLGSATGTTVRHTSPDRICDYNLSIPDNKTIIKFSETVKPILDNMLSNEQENQTLSTLRDSLLPKLMKGEIEI